MRHLLQILILLTTLTVSVDYCHAAITCRETNAQIRSTPRLKFSSLKLKTGIRVHYGQQGNPSGRPVILLHGFSDSWFSYSTVLPLLDNKYRVYVLDQRGHGKSDRPMRGYYFRHFAADVLAFMDAKNLKRATIVGHSMGSLVAQHVASIAPQRVERLVLIGSATAVRQDNATVAGLQRDINGLSDTVPEKFVREFQLSTIFKPLPDEFVEGVIKESMKLPARVWKEVLAGMLASESAQFTRINMPTLVLWGDRETIFNRAEQDSLTSALTNATFKVYPETGHALHWERPQEFAKDLQEFMSSNR